MGNNAPVPELPAGWEWLSVALVDHGPTVLSVLFYVLVVTGPMLTFVFVVDPWLRRSHAKALKLRNANIPSAAAGVDTKKAGKDQSKKVE